MLRADNGRGDRGGRQCRLDELVNLRNSRAAYTHTDMKKASTPIHIQGISEQDGQQSCGSPATLVGRDRGCHLLKTKWKFDQWFTNFRYSR